MMEYPLWKLPISQPINLLSRRDLVTYRKWFLENVQSRLDILDNAMYTRDEYARWDGTRSSKTLLLAESWLRHEVRRIWGALQATPPEELTSRAWDVGLHFACTLVNEGGWAWEQYLRSKNYVDYGHMIVRSSNRKAFRNTLRQANVMIERMHEGRWPDGELFNQYGYAIAEATDNLSR